jgi:hypothetical protein
MIFDQTKAKYEPHTFNKGLPSQFTTQLPTNEYAEHLRSVFKTVSEKMRTMNWKSRINVRLDLTDDEIEEVSAAIAFVAGSPSEFEPIPGGKNGKQRYRVTAAGYYSCVGA